MYSIHNGHFIHLDLMSFGENCKLDIYTRHSEIFIYLLSYLISGTIKNSWIIIHSATKLPKVKISDTGFWCTDRPKRMMQKFWNVFRAQQNFGQEKFSCRKHDTSFFPHLSENGIVHYIIIHNSNKFFCIQITIKRTNHQKQSSVTKVFYLCKCQ